MRLTLLLLIMISFILSLNAQKLNEKRGFFYLGEERYWNYEILDYLEDSNPEAYYWMKKSVSSKDAAATMSVLSIVSLGGGIVFMMTAKNDRTETGLGKATYGLGLLAIGSMFGMAALNQHSKGSDEEEKAINIYNENVELSQLNNQNYYFSIETSSSGIGLRMTF